MAKRNTTDHQFWIHHEVEKVKDENRRAFLYQLFSGHDGIKRFHEMMRSRKGAIEFKNGTWAGQLPKLTPKYLATKKRPCIGCGHPFIKTVSPWGEIVDEYFNICDNCEEIINSTQRQNPNQNNMTTSDEQKLLENIQSHREAIQADIKKMRGSLLKQLGEAKTTFNVLTSAHVGVPANELLADVEIAELLNAFRVVSEVVLVAAKPKGATSTKPTKKKDAEKKKTVRDWIVELLQGGKEMTRPEMEDEIKTATGKQPYNVYKYVTELLGENVLAKGEKKKSFKLK